MLNGTGRSALVVEDDPDNRDMLVEYLTCNGFVVSAACDGSEALARAAERRPDVVLTDLRMPALDGFELTRRIRADPALSGSIVIALTGMTRPADHDRAIQAGCSAVLLKPFSLKPLVWLITDLLKARSGGAGGAAVRHSPSTGRLRA